MPTVASIEILSSTAYFAQTTFAISRSRDKNTLKVGALGLLLGLFTMKGLRDRSPSICPSCTLHPPPWSTSRDSAWSSCEGLFLGIFSKNAEPNSLDRRRCPGSEARWARVGRPGPSRCWSRRNRTWWWAPTAVGGGAGGGGGPNPLFVSLVN